MCGVNHDITIQPCLLAEKDLTYDAIEISQAVEATEKTQKSSKTGNSKQSGIHYSGAAVQANKQVQKQFPEQKTGYLLAIAVGAHISHLCASSRIQFVELAARRST